MRGTLKIHFHTDTCFSMPAALDATVDANVALDPYGLPVAPGKTLHGLLRDTWLSLGPIVDPDNLGEALFGVTKSHEDRGLLRIGDAAITDETRRWADWAANREHQAVSPASLREAFLTERMLTAEDRTTDAPRQDTLRVIRVVPAGTTLYAPLTTHTGFTQPHRELLELLAKVTRHVGLDRNRGLGHVEITVHLEDERQQPHSGVTAQSGTHAVTFLPFRLRLTAPCLITGAEVDSNSQTTKPFITGAALRGAVAAALVRAGATQQELREILVSGTVRFLPAYPEISGQRATPVPITWQRDKRAGVSDAGAEVRPADVIMDLFADTSKDPNLPETQRQPVQSLFLAEASYRHYTAEVKTRYATHIQREAATGIARKDRATVFVYEAIEPDQSFYGCVALPTDRGDLQESVVALLQTPLWLGRSARSGYGGEPTIEFLTASHSTTNELGVPIPNLPRIEEDTWFTVRLTSDTLLRDPITGQHDPWQLEAALTAVFGAKAEPKAACIRAGRLRGYNSLWRTELPELPCASAGSVALFQAQQAISQEEIIALQSRALGERAAEGLGCFVIAIPSRAELTILDTASAKPNEPQVAETPMALEAQRRLYRQRLRVLLAQEAIIQAGKVSPPPSPSLIQRLRAPLGDPANLITTYRAWLAPSGDHALKDAARKQLERAWIGDRSLDRYLRDAVEPKWEPPLPTEAMARERYRLITEASAARIWLEEKRSLKIYYLDTLLSRLAKNAQQERPKAETDDAVEGEQDAVA
jgi:CRISPR-associated protein Csx10